MATIIQGKVEPQTHPLAPEEDEGTIVPCFPTIHVGADMIAPIHTHTPDQVLLGSLRDSRLKVCKPIKVSFSTEGTHVIAEAPGLSEFGFGDSHSAALADLQHAVAELYFTLEEEKEHLGNDLQEVWSRLRERIHKR